VILDFCTQSGTRRLLHLRNKQDKTALDIAKALAEKDTQHNLIYELLQAKHLALEKEINEAVDNILQQKI
jgi:hypothetical protein